ncbi:MAG TPA: nucleotide exchange factor GrpE [Firmicutes bacterium]|nr:nucleotide exchange factor GrpE [Bacillota bacterium]HWR55824.1 nucleotide exchange factor GrpE [Negativicutes bacterium]
MEEMKEEMMAQEVENEAAEAENFDAGQLAEKAKLADEYLTRLQRLQADFDNFRRRSQKEREELSDTVCETVICKFLPVIDNLERAIITAKNTSGDAQIIAGIEMILRQMEDVLGKLNVTAINAVGEPFDPQKHEAVMQVNDDSHADDTVIEEFQKGYQLKQRVIRPSMVKVVKN